MWNIWQFKRRAQVEHNFTDTEATSDNKIPDRSLDEI